MSPRMAVSGAPGSATLPGSSLGGWGSSASRRRRSPWGQVASYRPSRNLRWQQLAKLAGPVVAQDGGAGEREHAARHGWGEGVGWEPGRHACRRPVHALWFSRCSHLSPSARASSRAEARMGWGVVQGGWSGTHGREGAAGWDHVGIVLL